MEHISKSNLRNKYILGLYKLSSGDNTQSIYIEDLRREVNISDQEERTLYYYLKDKKLVRMVFQRQVNLTTKGIDKAEKLMQKSYAGKELLVLEKIYEMCQKSSNRHILYKDSPKDIDVDPYNLDDIIEELHNKGYLDSKYDEHYKISIKGIEFLQGRSNMPNHISARDIYNTNIHGNSNNQIGGQSNKQNAQININPEFDNAIKSIVELIKVSSISNFKKEDLITDIERIQNLAKNPPSIELVEHAKSKINYLDIALKGTDLSLKVAPYIPALIAYFEGLLT